MTERLNKYTCSLQTLSEQKIISVNGGSLRSKQIFEE